MKKINDEETARHIECKSSDFHARLIQEAITGFVSPDPVMLRSLVPVLMAIVNSLDTSGNSEEVRSLIMEKYEYVSENGSFKACKCSIIIQDAQGLMVGTDIRLIAFEVTESFYNIPEGKSGQQRWIKCTLRFLNYEALFNMDAWKASGNVEANNAAMSDFVNRQTVVINLD